MRDALAVYYFPGMWDWDSAIVLPLVSKGLDAALERQRGAQSVLDPAGAADVAWDALFEQAHDLLDRYMDWAPTVDLFSPIRVETEFNALVPDPADPDSGFVEPHGSAVYYTGRIDLLVTDEHDRYWILRHRLIDGPFPDTEHLLLDEEQVAGCWGWERFYDGMEISGTIYNEMSTSGLEGEVASHEPAVDRPRGVASIRRIYVKGEEDENVDRIRQTEGSGFRRTTIRRSRHEVSEAGRNVAAEVLDMVQDALRLYPNVAAHCAECAFVAPCLAMTEGGDAESILSQDYSRQDEEFIELGRLGGSPHGVGRGWVAPHRTE